MRLISPAVHGILDYVTVLYLILGPAVAGFEGTQRLFCYALAAAHLLLTLITRFRLGVLKTLPLPVHGAVELFVALLLLALPWIANFASGVHSRNFFLLTGIIVLLVWVLTDYRGKNSGHAHGGVE
jgi:hypothetical protein